MPKMRKDVLIMNKAYKEYCEYIARVSSQSMEQINDAMRSIMLSADCGKGINQRFKMLVDDMNELTKSEEKSVGNKRNGTQDRRQAFGGLF